VSQLDPAIEERIRTRAAELGDDPDEAVAEAELVLAEDSAEGGETGEAQGQRSAPPARPIADRLLIGFLPFILVRELRQHFLGLTEAIKDDDLTCGEFQAKYAGSLTASPSTTPVTPAPEGE
jgi:hypothetical protein